MPLSNKWWILCAVLLSCLVRFGSCRKAHGVPAEPVIFSELCALKDEPGPCRAIKDRYFFNVDSGRCELFEYGGCGGNQNNFETLEECEETCLVSDKKNPCHLPQAPGPCRGLVSRFFFDSSSQECKQFYYGGCFGNANNFRTMAECQAKCLNPAPESPSPRKDDVQPIIETGNEFQENKLQMHLWCKGMTQIQRQTSCASDLWTRGHVVVQRADMHTFQKKNDASHFPTAAVEGMKTTS
ncbi:tissue factor pathway inhibitor a isoform X2 [Simochromis diagramma]|uniref:tissue factor pathway inhibitor a isoform X2 n=1 Tax=Simochromis diagramma TaxID=43689 RepID=UPI001A7E7310|nr:tissue factor pathway inhibitor a isoform X2 [Simochromis diagramma]